MAAENMMVSLVDPRYVSVEVLTPVYRVDFWNKNRDTSEHRLENAACVDDVRSWAETNRNSRQAVIWVEYNYERDRHVPATRGGTNRCGSGALDLHTDPPPHPIRIVLQPLREWGGIISS